MVFSSPVKSNTPTTIFRLGVFFYKTLETMEELVSFSDRVGFSYLCIVIKKCDPVSALVVACNGKEVSNISMDELKWVSSWFGLSFI